MSIDSSTPMMNGHRVKGSQAAPDFTTLNGQLNDVKVSSSMAKFHGDELLADQTTPLSGIFADVRDVLTLKGAANIAVMGTKALLRQGTDVPRMANLAASFPNNSATRASLINAQVKDKYEKMLHPPLTYLGDAFQYRQADGKFNSVLHPHLGQAGAPYAKTVPSITHSLGAMPDPGDIFDRLMARQKNGRESKSGLSSMLIYHATVIIHDIFRTNDTDKNISDSSSYLDLSPLYGYTEEMTRKIRDDKYRLGLLRPDTFAEDRLVRQPPGVCIYLVMYNRYHNYAARQLYRINENNRFRVPDKYSGAKLAAIAEGCVSAKQKAGDDYMETIRTYRHEWKAYCDRGQTETPKFTNARADLQLLVDQLDKKVTKAFSDAYDAAWTKLDDDLFNTARLITCGLYINVSIHDYLRALMGFHQWNTNFTLDPRINNKNVSRGIGNQVTVEFNLLYRFHCAISKNDESFTEKFIQGMYIDFLDNQDKAKTGRSEPWDAATRKKVASSDDFKKFDPKDMSLYRFIQLMQGSGTPTGEPDERTFGLKDDAHYNFQRDDFTKLFDDQKMITHLMQSMKDPISNFGPNNVPVALKNVEIMGMHQARKWEIGTLNDFREFFQMPRHTTFEGISKDVETQNALRDLYDHPDKVELYPGAFCESLEGKDADPGPSGLDSALWAAIFSDAITLVRSDRFYTVDWNTKSLTSWGMKEVSPDNDVLKSSVFHRLLQRAFPEWFPYDSIRFFHPFYTPETNARYAYEQGYADKFKIHVQPSGKLFERAASYKYDLEASEPIKPLKPVFLKTYKEIKALLSQSPAAIVNPAIINTATVTPTPSKLLPAKVREVVDPRTTSLWQEKEKKSTEVDVVPSNATEITRRYFTELMREIILREAIPVVKGILGQPTFQIDATRDMAIPVITRYVGDFLGFTDKIRIAPGSKATFSENHIYQHITNCQVFLSYNADETKMWKRRDAFKTSMQFLYELAESGNIKEASRWWPSWGGSGDASEPRNHIKNLGKTVAKHILSEDSDTGRAAAKLLLIALDSAYNSVLAFSSVLNYFVNDLYDFAGSKQDDKATDVDATGKWLEIQQLALADTAKSDDMIRTEVLRIQRSSVKIPIVRKAAKALTIMDPSDKTKILFKVQQGDTIVCDVHAAMAAEALEAETKKDYQVQDLTYGSALSEFFAHYNPKDTAVDGLTAMIKVVAQLKNLRRGHDVSGHLKKIQIDSTNEGWANFMAPLRVKSIAQAVAVESAKKDSEYSKEYLRSVYDPNVLKPAYETFLTPEWDEMVPFPTTWKVRFDGYGPSDYGDIDRLPMVVPDKLPDFFPPFYQPQGASTFGGSFAEVVCICNTPGLACKCKGAKEEGKKTEGEHMDGVVLSSTMDVNKVVAKAAWAAGASMPADGVDIRMGGCGVPGTGRA
ncbi:MAG: hypothetical protein M1828_004181 [Chrysothrix sp. TS-e1954]|nr:MAG: hypothetical protein M1828_004181 [Chrysothrix sp. TS-e1954]